MNYELTKISNTNYGPCHIEYSVKFGLFIVGTYKLVEEKNFDDYEIDHLKSINYRKGSFLLFNKENQCIASHDCLQGGVYDFKLINCDWIEHNVEVIVAAHANGTFAFYRLYRNSFEYLCCCSTSCALLCSIDYIINRNQILIATGGLDGWFSHCHCKLNDSLNSNYFTCFDSVETTNYKLYFDNIWFIKLLPFEAINLLFIGSEDSFLEVFEETWFVYLKRLVF